MTDNWRQSISRAPKLPKKWRSKDLRTTRPGDGHAIRGPEKEIGSLLYARLTYFATTTSITMLAIVGRRSILQPRANTCISSFLFSNVGNWFVVHFSFISIKHAFFFQRCSSNESPLMNATVEYLVLAISNKSKVELLRCRYRGAERDRRTVPVNLKPACGCMNISSGVLNLIFDWS